PDKIRNHLMDATGIRLHPGTGPSVHTKGYARVAGDSRERLGDARRDAEHVDVDRMDGELSRLEPREVHQVADEPLEPLRLADDDAARFPRVRRGAVGQRLAVAADGRERRAQLV